MRAGRYRGSSPVWATITVAIMAFFVVFLLFPMALVLYKSFVGADGSSLSLGHFAKFFHQKYYWITLVNSFRVIVCATLCSVALGIPIAYFMRTAKIAGKGLLEILIIVSFISPPFIGAYAWIQLLGRQGAITKVIDAVFGVRYNGIYGFAGIVLAFTLQSFPLIYIYVSGALKNMDSSLVEAAESLGCTGFRRAATIVTPLVMPSILASSLLVFMRDFADFGTPMLIGEGYKTMPVLIYNEFMSELGADDGFAAALSVIAIVITTLVFIVQKRIASMNAFSMSALRPIVAKRVGGLKGSLVHAFVYAVVLLAITPQAVVIYTSFLKSNGGQVFVPGFSLQSYASVFSGANGSAVWNTYRFGLEAIAIILVVGVLVSYLTVRKRSLLTDVLDTITIFPYIIPGSVLGICFLFAFSRQPLILNGTAIILVLSFAMRRMPYTIRSSTAVLSQISPSVEEAAVSLGASEMGSFLEVTLPMMAPGVLAGAIMSWITAISELSSSIILYGNNTQTLTIAVYTAVVRGNYGNAAAFSTLLTATSIISLLLLFKLTGRREVSV